MDDQLILLTSCFNLVNGRQAETLDTFRIEDGVPSDTSPDGNATLYIVTESSGSGQLANRARARVADTVVWEYRQHPDVTPVVRLKSALQSAHETLLAEFDGHASVGASVIAVEQNTIYLAQVAPAQVYVLSNGELQAMSAAARGSSPFARALGSSGGPKIDLFRDEIAADDVIALCSSWFHRGAEAADLRECFAGESADEIAAALLQLARAHDVRDATAIVVEAVPRSRAGIQDEELPPTFLEQVDNAVQAVAEMGRSLWMQFRAVPDDEPEEDVLADASTSPVTTLRPRRRTRSTTSDRGGELGTNGSEPDDMDSGGQSWNSEGPMDRTSETPIVMDRTAEDTAPLTERRGARSLGKAARRPQTPATDMEQTGQWEILSSRQRQDLTQEIPAVDEDATAPPDSPVLDSPAIAGDVESTIEPPATQEDHGAHQIDREAQHGTRAGRRRTVRRPTRPVEAEPEEEGELDPERQSELDRVNSRLQAEELGGIVPPVQAFDATSVEPERIYATSKDIQAANRRPRRFGGIARPANDPVAAAPPVLRPGLRDIDLERPASRPAPPAVIWLGLAVVVMLVLAAGYEYWQHRHSVVAADPYPNLVQQNLALAQNAKAPATQELYLNRARTYLARAEAAGAPAATIARLRRQIGVTSDTIHHITRVYSPILLTDFSKYPNANPAELAVSPGVVYTLDQGRHAVFAVRPTAPGAPDEVMQTGDQVSGFTVGNVQHIATAGAIIMALDDHNVLVRDDNGTKTATSLTPQNAQEKIVAMASVASDVYLLDDASNQVWQYPQAVTGYNPPASAYFTPPLPALSSATSFAFDSSAMYVMQQSGSILKFDFQSHPLQYNVKVTPGQDQIFSDVNLNYVWVADPAGGRIFQYDKSGNRIRTYISGAKRMDFGQIHSFAVGPAGNTFYVLAGKKLFAFPVQHA